LERSILWHNEGTVLEFIWRVEENSEKLLRIASSLAKIQIKHIPEIQVLSATAAPALLVEIQMKMCMRIYLKMSIFFALVMNLYSSIKYAYFS
jgi:hypothetical protein